MSNVFSMFSQSSPSRKRSDSGSSFAVASLAEPSVVDPPFRRLPCVSNISNQQSCGSELSISQLRMPNDEPSSLPHSSLNSPAVSSAASPWAPSHIDKPKHFPKPLLSPATSPSIDTQLRASATSIPSQKLLSQLTLSLALRTATIQTQLPVIRPAVTVQGPQSHKIKSRFFGGSTKHPKSPCEYELAGRSTFALVHGAILRYHSEFGDEANKDATPDNTHFLDGSSIVRVTDAIQGFKWVLEVKTWAGEGLINSPMKRSKSTQKLVEKKVDLTRLPWGIVDGIQAWYLVFETATSMTEWMTILRSTVVSIREREAKVERSPSRPTPKPISPSSSKEPSKNSKNSRSAQVSSPISTLEESLSSSPSSSPQSFDLLGDRDSFGGDIHSKRLSDASTDGAQTRQIQSSLQHIALSAFRISAFEGDLEAFIPSDQSTAESRTSPKTPAPEPSHCILPILTPNLSHYSNKRASTVSLQSRISSLSSGPRTPLTHTTVSPTASTPPPRHRRALRRTQSGESASTNNSWKQHHQNHGPPHPPPTCPLPLPPPMTAQCDYIAAGHRESSVFDQLESIILGINPALDTETPKTFLGNTPRICSPDAAGLSSSSIDALIPQMESLPDTVSDI